MSFNDINDVNNNSSLKSSGIPKTNIVAVNTAIVIKKEDLLRDAIIAGCSDYLNNTSFGLLSFYYHGEVGRIRVMRILEIFNDIAISRNFKALEYLFYSIINSNSISLKKYVISNVLVTGIYSENLLLTVKRYSTPEFADKKLEYSFQSILKSRLGIVDQNQIMIDQLTEYLDSKIVLEKTNDYHTFFRWLLI
jgi:hypothetical protein